MKPIYYFIFLIFLPNLVFCQGSINPTWIKIDSAGINRTSEAWGIDVDQNNEVFWAVSNNQFNQGLDINCYKFDINGNPLWPVPFVYGGAGTQHAYVCNAQDTALYVGGRFCTGLLNSCDMLLLKMDKNTGELIWDKSMNFSANGYDEVDGLEIRDDGIYCGGWAQEFNPLAFRTDIGLWKLDFNGNRQWANSLGLPNSAEHQDGHFVVDSNFIYAAGLWQGSGLANLYNGYSFLGKFNKANGNLIDSTLFGHQSNAVNDIENALGMTSDGEYLYVTGYSTPTNANDWQIFVAKFDKNLKQLWFTDWGGTGTESARGIKVNNGKIYVAGSSESTGIMTGGNRDALLLTLDADGNVLDYKTYGGLEKESFQDLAVHKGNIFLTGTIESGTSKKSMLLAVSDTISTSVKQGFHVTNTYKIYPNPASGILTIEFNVYNHDEGNIRVSDSNGKLVLYRQIKPGIKHATVEIDHSGYYVVQIQFPNYSVSHKIINRR